MNLICKICKKKLKAHAASQCLDRTLLYLLTGELEEDAPAFSTELEWSLVALGVAQKATRYPDAVRLLRNKVNDSSLFIFLTEEEVKDAEELGVSRNQTKIKSLRNKVNFSNIDNEVIHIRGALSEIAFAKISNFDVNRDFYKNHGDETDFEGIDIKGASHRGHDVELKVPVKDWESKPQNYYVLSRFFAENYGNLEIVGSIDSESFNANKATKKYSKYGPLNYIVGAKHLKPISEMSDCLKLKTPLELCREAIEEISKSLVA